MATGNLARKRDYYGKSYPAGWPKCGVEGCNNPAQSRVTPLCHCCYCSINYHVKKGTAHVVQWGVKLRLFTARHGMAAGNAPVLDLMASRRKGPKLVRK